MTSSQFTLVLEQRASVIRRQLIFSTMRIISAFLLLPVLYQETVADFDCDAETKPDNVCKEELDCSFNEDFEERRGYSRHCRCRTIITDLLPEDHLAYPEFRKICSKFEENLRQLWIHDTNIKTIDNDIFASYPNLHDVNLAGNKLELNFSEAAGSLEKVDVSRNRILVLEPRHFDHLKSARVLNVSHNGVGEVNNCFKNINALEEIYLNNNKIKIIRKGEFEHLKNLRVLNLANNLLSAIESSLVFANLRELNLNDNKLTDLNSNELVNLPNLAKLDIGRNNFESLDKMQTFTKLEVLNSDNNKLKSIEPSSFQNLNSLKVLNVSNNEIATIPESTFAVTARIGVLDVSSNALTGIGDNNFKNNFQDLTILNLHNNSLDESILNCDNFQHLMKLNILDLSFNQVGIVYNCTFTKLEQLEKLNLMANKLKTVPANAFDSLTQLKDLNLAQNQITSLPDNVLDKTRQLERFNVSHNQLKHFDPELLKNTQNLQELDVKDNKIQDFDLEKLKLLAKSLRFVDVDEEALDCKNVGNILEYFIENNLLEPCRGGSCCGLSQISRSRNQIFIYIGVAVGILVLALIGLAVILKHFCCPQQPPAFHLVQIDHSKILC